jgi:hypothetical protein
MFLKPQEGHLLLVPDPLLGSRGDCSSASFASPTAVATSPGRPGPRPGSGSSRSEPPRREGAPSRPLPPDARGGGGARSTARSGSHPRTPAPPPSPARSAARSAPLDRSLMKQWCACAIGTGPDVGNSISQPTIGLAGFASRRRWYRATVSRRQPTSRAIRCWLRPSSSRASIFLMSASCR